MSKQLTEQELEALFQKYLPTDEMPAAMAQRIENQVLYEVGLSLRSERGGATNSARNQSWFDRLFGSIPKLRIGPSLALASASAVAILLLFTYGTDLANRLNDTNIAPDTGSATIQDTPTPESDEGSVVVVPTQVPAEEETTAVAEASEPTDTPLPTDTSEPVEEAATPSPVAPDEEGSQGSGGVGTNDSAAESESSEDSVSDPVAPVVNEPAGDESTAVETAAPTSQGANSGTIGANPTPKKTSTGNITSSPATMPTTEGSAPLEETATPAPTVASTVRATNTPTPEAVAQARPTATPTATSRNSDVVPSPTSRQQVSNTATPKPTITPTVVAQATNTEGDSSNPIKTPQATSTPTASATKTATPVVIVTEPAATATPTATLTPNVESPITATPTPTSTKVVIVENQSPIPVPDSGSTLEEQLVRISVLANDSDPEGEPLTLVSVGAAKNGTTAIEGRQIEYVPRKDYHGEDSFTYTVSDGRTEATGTVALTVGPVNDEPIARDDAIDANEDVVARFNALTNDTDVDQDTLSIRSFSQASHGIVAVEGNEFVYKPILNYSGADSFTYVMTDGTVEVEARVNIQIVAVNDPPSAQVDSASVDEDASISIAVLSNDSDVEGDSLKIATATSPINGAVAVSADGLTILYTPAPDFNGSDEFGYTVTDGSLSTSGIVRVSVTAVNDAPVVEADTASTREDTPVVIDVRANDSDVDGDVLTITSFEQGTNGTVVASGTGLLYTPNENFSGVDQFGYIVSDGLTNSETGIVVVNVSPDNDAPVAENDAATVVEDGSITIDVLRNDSDAEGQALSITQVGAAQNGVAVVEGNAIRYTPNQNFNGADQFTYTVSDGTNSVTATVSVTVTPVNDPPAAADLSVSVNEDSEVSVLLLPKERDIDGDTLTVTVVQPAHGTVTVNGRNAVYKPAADYNGPDTFDYTVSDGVESKSAKVTITVRPVNDPPVVADVSVDVAEDGEVSVSLLSTDKDVDGDTLTLLAVGQPAHGSVTRAGANVVYKPAADYSGPDEFSYTISDGTVSKVAKVKVTVTAVNDAPEAKDDSSSTAANQAIAIEVLSNDTDVDTAKENLMITANKPVNGSVVISKSLVIYTPNPGFSGTDSFTYTVSDGSKTATATVSVTVSSSNNAPDAKDDSAATTQGEAVVISALGNDTDAEGDSLTIVSVGASTAGATLVTNGSVITYTPSADFATGSDTFTYTVSDGIETTTATVNVTVSAPTAP